VAFAKGKQQLEVAKRQAVVYSLYAPKAKSVMELKVQSQSNLIQGLQNHHNNVIVRWAECVYLSTKTIRMELGEIS
jgi:hypothetical protein